jgi:hypothetical protein
LRKTLKFLQNHPEEKLQVGTIPDGQNAFFLNSSIASQFFRLKNRNYFNLNVKQHRFIVERSSTTIQQFTTFYQQLIPASQCLGKTWIRFS